MFLENMLGWIDVMHSHNILHDAFSRFDTHHSLDRGYCCVIPEKFTTKYMKSNPLFGQIFGILYCSINKIVI